MLICMAGGERGQRAGRCHFPLPPSNSHHPFPTPPSCQASWRAGPPLPPIAYVRKGAGSPSTAGWTGRRAGRSPGARTPPRTGTRRWHRSCCRRRCRRGSRSAEASGRGSASLPRGRLGEGLRAMGHSPGRGARSPQPGRRGQPLEAIGASFTLDADGELAAGSVVCLVVGRVADDVLSFGEFGAGLRATQHHPAPGTWVSPSGPWEVASSTAPTALTGGACATPALTS